MTGGQVSTDAAQVYENVLVPTVFAEWAPRALDAAGVTKGTRLLDVACGTGIVAREGAKRGAVATGLDRNAGMLAVARRVAPQVDWREGSAEKLPFPDASFDAVTCTFGLMWFQDQVAALREMRRVARPGARLALLVWDDLSRQPDGPIVDSLRRRYGAAADELGGAFALGDPAKVESLFREAGLAARTERILGTARAESAEAYVEGLLKGWTLADRIGPDLPSLVKEIAPGVAKLAKPAEGGILLPAPAILATATR